jgi:predicted  nucleic acid-binding Zn-ribbon protein
MEEQSMSEIDREYVVQPRAPGWLIALSVIALLAALGALGWSLGLQNHLAAAEQSLAAANQQNTALTEKMEDTNERLKAQGEALGQSVGLTQKQLEDRSHELVVAEKRAQAAQASTARLARQQAATNEATNKQIGAVQNDVSAVKTDVGGVKNDVASTQADLASTKTQLTRVMGDAGVMSGLIATNHDELQELKRRGERNYYEFTLHKGGPAQNVGTIKLALKKVNEKKSKYTLNVDADDKTVEKKDKNLDEPVQFYSGKTPALFEIVVNNISKNQVSGYLSTPKNAPAPISVP